MSHRRYLPWVSCVALLVIASISVAYYFTVGKVRPISDGIHKIVGKILQMPEAPDPANSEYADCLGIAEVEVLGVMGDISLPNTILVAFSLFKASTLSEAASYKSGDRLEICLLGSDEVGEELKSMQRVDEVDNFALTLYYASSAQRWEPGSRTSVHVPADTTELATVSANEDFRDTRTGAAKHARQAAIQADLDHIDHLISAHGNSWEQWANDVKPWRDQLGQLIPLATGGFVKDGLYFERLHHSQYQEMIDAGDESPPLRMIRALHAELDARGIDLLVVPFPFREEVFADTFLADAPTDGIFAPERLRVVQSLLQSNVEVLDLTGALREAAAGERRTSLYYPYEDPHPADSAIQLTATSITERLKRYGCPAELLHLKSKISSFTMPEKFQKRRATDYKYMPDDPVFQATVVTESSGDLLPTGGSSSPFLLIGDSFIRCPSIYRIHGADIKDQIALRSGIIPATLGIYGSAGQSMRNLAREGEAFLHNRKVVILMFSSIRLFPSKKDDADRSRQWEIVPLGR